MTAKELKASILQLAVTGKLVLQDPNDEPASVLLERIKAEKAKLVKAGKIKKDKNPSEIVTGSDGAVYEKFKDGTVKDISDELPFEIPTTWRWVKIKDVFSMQAGKYVSASQLHPQSDDYRFPCFGGNGIRGYLQKFSHEGEHAIVGRQGALCGNLNLAKGKFYATEHAVVVDSYCGIDAHFAYWFLMAMNLNQYATATAQPGLSVKVVLDSPFPLPPLAEQKRIVAKIEKLMPLVEEYGKMEETRLQLDADLPATLEKSILQEAIQGKLVPQDPNDEPASELLKRIANERKALVKAGKLKRDKGESVIFRGSDRLAYETRNGETVCIQDEIPFEIPDSWEWVRMGCMIKLVSGVSYDKDDVIKSGIRILRGGNVKGDGKLYLWEDDVFLPATYSNKENEIHKDDVVIVAATGSSAVIGRAAVASIDMSGVQIGAFLRIARPLFADVNTWLALIFHSPFYRQHIQDKAKGTNIRNLKAEYITDFIIPLPPLAEQKRIVAKIEELRTAIKSFTT